MQVEEAVERRVEALRAAGNPVPRRKVLHQQVVHVSVDGRKVCAHVIMLRRLYPAALRQTYVHEPFRKWCDHLWLPLSAAAMRLDSGMNTGSASYAHWIWLCRSSSVTRATMMLLPPSTTGGHCQSRPGSEAVRSSKPRSVGVSVLGGL